MMKKIFALVFLLVLGKFSYSQGYPLTQYIGSDSTIVISKAALQSRLVNLVISDTTAANTQRIKQYPGAMLYTSDGSLWVRNATATKWLLLSSGSVGAVNIYNSNGTLTGNRTFQGNGKDLLFDNIGDFSVVGNGVTLTQNGGSASFFIKGDTSSFVNRASYSANYASDFTKHSLVDKNYVDSSIGSIPSGGTVTSVATNNSTGITGGTITTSGTLAIDTTLISTRAWRQKGIDSVQANINALTFQKSLINGSTLTQNNTVNVNKKGFTWNNGGYYEFNDSLGTTLLSMSKSIIDLFVANAGTGVPSAAISLGRGVYISGGDSISISPYQGKLNISSLRSGAGSKALKYDPTTGVVSYSDTTAASGGTVTSVATNTATGITGGTITTSGTLAIDTTLISTRAWRQKGIDSVASLVTNGYVPNSRTITINGTTQDLSANRTWSVGTVTSVATNYGLTGGTITSSGTLSVDSASLSNYYLRRKDSLTSTNPLGYVTNKVLADTASAIRASIPTPTGGTVTSVATNNSTGITGGTITSTGTLAIDTTLISTRAWRQKGIDSVASLPKVTSVGLSMPSAFNVANSPITSSGTIAVTGAGTNSQYIKGDGTLGTLPSIAGQIGWYGSFSDTLNQIATSTGVSYPIYIRITDNANGVTNDGGNAIIVNNTGVYNIQYSIQFVNTDNTIHDVDVFLVYNGNVLASSNSQYSVPNKHGSVDGHLIAAINYVLPLNAGDSINLQWRTTDVAVSIQTLPATTGPSVPRSPGIILTVTSQAAIGIGYQGLTSGSAVTLGTGSKTFTTNLNNTQTAFAIGTRVRVTDSTNTANYLEGPITSFSGTTMVVNADLFNGSGSHSTWKVSVAGEQGSGGIQSLNGLTSLTQTFATGTSGTDFNISSVSSTHTFNLPTASATNRGALSSADWTTFNNKGNGSVTSVATNTATGITGGTITTTGTLAIDTTLISTRAWRQKGIDSVAALPKVTSVATNTATGIAGGTITSTGTLYIDTTLISTRAWRQKGIDSVASLVTSGYVPNSRTLTINGTSYDLSANRTWSVGTVTSVATNTNTGITGGTITGSGTLAIDTLLISTRAWRQKGVDSVAALITGGGYVTGSGTTNYVPKFTSSSAIGNSNLINDASGNLGLGVTPNTWSLGKIIQIESTTALWNDSYKSTYLSNNVYYNSGFKYQVNGYANAYLIDANGRHIWYNAPSGTAGNAISFTQAMTLDASGNLGIGTTSPQDNSGFGRIIDLDGTSSSAYYTRYNGSSTIYALFGQDASNSYLYTKSTPLLFYTNASERLRITSGGNVGIGTTSPAYKLQVTGTSTALIKMSNTYANRGIVFGVDGSSEPSIQAVIDNSDIARQLSINPSGGNVGIGNTSPSQKLTIGDGSGTGNQYIRMYNSASDIYLGQTGSNLFGAGNGQVLVADATYTSNFAIGTISPNESVNLIFGTNNLERMRIRANGNILIGTTTDAGQKFQVNGSAAVANGISVGSGYQVTFSDIGGSVYSYIEGSSYSVPFSYLAFGAGNAERMRITSNGDLVVGASSNPYSVTNRGSIFLNGTNSSLYGWGIGGASKGYMYHEGTNIYMENSVSGGSFNLYQVGAGYFTFNTNGSERMRITSGGAVGINTSSPYGGSPLTLQESSSLGAALAMRNRNSTETWLFAVDANAVDDKWFQIVQASAGARLLITGGGNVLVGTTTDAGYKLDLFGQQRIYNAGLTLDFTANVGGIRWDINPYIAGVANGGLQIYDATNGASRLAIDQWGQVMIGNTGLSVGAKLQLKGDASTSAMSIQIGTDGYPAITFQNSSGYQQGYIVTNSSSVQYLSISDYRLKQDLKTFNGLSLIDSIKVYDYQWKLDSTRAFGVLAHELQTIIPSAVYGEKDGEKMQAVDYSKLVPVLVQAIKDLKAEIEELKKK